MDSNPGLLGSETGDLEVSVKLHFPPDDFTAISPIEDGAPNSATYTVPPVPVVFSSANDARYDQPVT